MVLHKKKWCQRLPVYRRICQASHSLLYYNVLIELIRIWKPKIFKIIRSVNTFYKNFFILSFFITLICLAVIAKSQFSFFSYMFWFKLGTNAMIYYFISDYKHKEFYYFQNLGVSRTLLWTSTAVIDATFFLGSCLLIYSYK